MGSTRNRRVSEEIRKVVSDLLLRGLKDPRISKFTSVTDVQTTRDLRYTYIYISVYDPNANRQETVEALNRAKGFIRNEIGKNIDLRYTPEPIFREDDSVDNAMHIQDILSKVVSTEDDDYEVEYENEEDDDYEDDDYEDEDDDV
ncbi:MAG: 30S ribosome-binding factor RbfA [Clostridia bacterium]|nr:30S ribosome-binding factor RbfA [Clostridia bacterium]